MKKRPPKPGQIKVYPSGDVVIGAPVATVVVKPPKEDEN